MTTTDTITAGDKVYRIGFDPMTGEVDPAWFHLVTVAAIGTYPVGHRWEGVEYVDYIATGYGARADLDDFVPRSAVKRVNVNGRRRLIWR